MKRMLMLALLAGLMTGGCYSRMFKEGAGAAMGAKGVHAPIVPLAEASANATPPLAGYSSIELGEVTDDFASMVPPAFFEALPAEFAQEIKSAKLPLAPTGPTLLVRGRVVYYENASLLANALGPLEEVVARMQLVDAASGEVISEAMCVGRTKESVNLGPAKKAEGLSKAIVEWIKPGFPAREKQ